MLILMHFCTNSWEGKKNEINFSFEYTNAEVQYKANSESPMGALFKFLWDLKQLLGSIFKKKIS